MDLITKEGYIIKKQDNYKRNKNMLKTHFRSSSPNRVSTSLPNRDGHTKKTKKSELVDKEEHE